MHRFLLPLVVLGLLMVTACASNALEVRNSNDRIVGTIDVQAEKSATFLNTHGDVRGRVRGNVVRDDTGKNMGVIVEKDGNTVIQDPQGNALGSVKEGNCYGKGQEKIGNVSGEIESNILAGACLLFFLQ